MIPRKTFSNAILYALQVYIIAEGVASNLFKKMYKLNSRNDNVEKLVKVLEKMKVMSLKTPEEVSNLFF